MNVSDALLLQRPVKAGVKNTKGYLELFIAGRGGRWLRGISLARPQQIGV